MSPLRESQQWRQLSPFIQLSDIQRKSDAETPQALFRDQYPKALVRRLRGGKMQSVHGLMNELGAALQFFEGFGENWHALKECLSYLDEWLPADQYILLIQSGHRILAEEPAELEWLLKTLHEAGAWWSKPITDNEPFNRPAKEFRAIFTTHTELLDLTFRRFELAFQS